MEKFFKATMLKENDLFFTNFPSKRLTLLSYFAAFFFLLKAKISGKTLVFNLPYEISHPCEVKEHSLYYRYQEGVRFIRLIEGIKKFFFLKVLWQTNPASFPSCLKNIDLLLNIKKPTLKTKRLTQLLKDYKERIKMVLLNQKVVASVE